jgi:Outer membrane protein beta-barrel domain
MSRWTAGLAALSLSLLGAPALHAQGAEFSIGGGVGVPLGNFDDVVKIGWQGTAAVSFVPRRLPVGIQVDGSFSQFGDESPLDIKSQLIYGTANAVYRFLTSESSRFRPYLIGGGGVYNSKSTGSDALSGSTTKFGLNAGAGVDFKAGSAGLFLEGRFHDVFVPGPNLQFLPVNLGIRLGGT